PLHRVAAGPVAGRARADLQRHANPVAGIPAAAAHLGEVPGGAEVKRAHFRIGLEAAARQDDGSRTQLMEAVVAANAHAVDPAVLVDELDDAGAVLDLDAVLEGGLGQHLHEARPAADSFDRKASPELELAVDLEGLPAVDRDQPDALAGHPFKRV